VKREREERKATLRENENSRSDELMAFSNLGGTPTYPSYPVSMALEGSHLSVKTYLTGLGRVLDLPHLPDACGHII
jgi:hypothetical protein